MKIFVEYGKKMYKLMDRIQLKTPYKTKQQQKLVSITVLKVLTFFNSLCTYLVKKLVMLHSVKTIKMPLGIRYMSFSLTIVGI